MVIPTIFADTKLSNTDLTFTEDIEMRFKSINWNVLYIQDGNNDLNDIYEKLAIAKNNKTRPTIIIMKTIIGYGSLKENTCKVHGSPLEQYDIEQQKLKLNFNPNNKFYVDDNIIEYKKKRENDFKDNFQNNL